MEPKPTVDLDEVQKLVDQLERDIEKARAGAGDVETLRREVEALRVALSAPEPEHHAVRERLHGVRETLDEASESSFAVKAGDYIARIGRMLGM